MHVSSDYIFDGSNEVHTEEELPSPLSAYGASKAGLELLTKVMAVELAEHGINVNNIAPGAIETDIARIMHDRATRAAYGRLIPMVRYGTPEEIADAAVFLCSDEARYIHGHTLNVDGGFREAGLMFKRDVPPGALAVSAADQRNIDEWVLHRRPGTSSAEAAQQAIARIDEQ